MPPLAIYNPSKLDKFHRVTCTNRLSKYATPEKCYGAMVEMTVSNQTDFVMTDEIISESWKTLKNLFGVTVKEPILTYTHYSPFAYLLSTNQNLEYKNQIINFLETECGIILAGRLGRFDYINMDAAFEHASEAASKANRF